MSNGNRRTVKIEIVIALFLLLTTYVESEEVVIKIPSDNAALSYWLAFAQQSRPNTIKDLAAIQFIEGDLQHSPPSAITARPNVWRILQSEKKILDTFGEGIKKKYCNFGIDYSKGMATALPHLTPLRRLAYHVLAIAKLYELEDKSAEAAMAYGYLLRFITHLDQENDFTTGVVANKMLNRILLDVEGFLTRSTDRQGLNVLWRHLEVVPAVPLHLDKYLRTDSQRIGDWLLSNPSNALKCLEDIVGEAQRPARILRNRLSQLAVTERRELLAKWVAEYRTQLTSLAEATRGQYFESIDRVKEADQKLEVVHEAFERNPSSGNPLIRMLVHKIEHTYIDFSVTQTRLGALRVMCAVCIAKANHDKYPTDLSELRPFFPKGLPKNPLTGEVYPYRANGTVLEIDCATPVEIKDTKLKGFRLRKGIP